MIYSTEVEHMTCVAKGPNHGPAPIPEEGRWVQAKEIKDISGLTHGVGWCAPQQGACKLTLNVKDGVIQEALVETIGCSGMTHSAAMAAEILPNVLHVATGHPDLMVFLANTTCGLKAYAGPASSYYEDLEPNFNRLTDDDWKTTLNSGQTHNSQVAFTP